MSYPKKLGIFARDPVPGEVKTRLVPPLDPQEACDVYAAFLADLFARVGRLKKVTTTVFFAGSSGDALAALSPQRFGLEPQCDGDLGQRMNDACVRMLPGDGAGAAVLIGSDSPDIPLPFIKRAFVKLKHRDVVLGPAVDGGYYLIGLRRPAPGIFDGVPWGQASVLGQTLERIHTLWLSLAVLPVWYDVDTIESLAFLRTMLSARRVEGSAGLPNVTRLLSRIDERCFSRSSN